MSTTVKLTPASGKISGSSHSNMPLAIIPSGITNLGGLTLTEAESCRIYTDSGLTTEVAREVVSADEIHHDSATLTSSSEYYFDYDGVRSDYATTATYGAEAVWSAYEYVAHDGGGTDSTGNTSPTAYGGVTTGGATGKIGSATDYDGTDDYVDVGAVLQSGTGDFTFQAWLNPDAISSTQAVAGFYDTTINESNSYYNRNNTIASLFYQDQGDGSNREAEQTGTAYSNGTWRSFTSVFDISASDLYPYTDGSSDPGTNWKNTGAITDITNTLDWYIGARNTNGSSGLYWNGQLDEVRIRYSALSSDWIATEYNNQNDNAAFWVSEDVSTVGGDPVQNSNFLMFM